MATESMDDQYSIKNLLFYRAIPNHVIPVPTNGYKVYGCIDCGDRFIFQSSYEQHVHRKSVKITYTCRNCNQVRLFFNRCNLLSHIRSHTFKTATINVSDLKLEPLPPSHFRADTTNLSNRNNSPQSAQSEKTKKKANYSCFECKLAINTSGVMYKDRAKHYMQLTNQIYTCPVCLFAMPTLCGLKSHLRVHLKCPPYYCPECGIFLSTKAIHYPYNHDCEGFRMMRATARFKCPLPNCHIFHPNDFKEHMKKNHLRKVYKCQFCVVACFNEQTIIKHLKTHESESKALIFYQCEMCPGRLVLNNQMDNHLKSHVNTNIFPCWGCGATFKDIITLLNHHINDHNASEEIKNVYSSFHSSQKSEQNMRIYRVVKKCSRCKRSFTYKCKYNEIAVLPQECPYKCSLESINSPDKATSNIEAEIKCHMCENKVSENWGEIKKHYASHHKDHRCLDIKIVLSKLDQKELNTKKKMGKKISNVSMKKRSRKTRRNINTKIKILDENYTLASSGHIDEVSVSDSTSYSCSKCEQVCENKLILESHMVSHRDPCMAYQCMECGQSFAVKPSFSTHLFVDHGIENVEEYIIQKQCYNENALVKSQSTNNEPTEPLRNNQCRICREQFDNSEDLEKHFRVHGMAFLLKNTTKNNTNI
ncbi:LOW QUALITY PROTEIN: zinc finger protein 532 [Aphomia sociella]